MRASGSGAARADRDSLARAAPKLRRFRRYANQRGIDIMLSGIFAMRVSGLGAVRRDLATPETPKPPRLCQPARHRYQAQWHNADEGLGAGAAQTRFPSAPRLCRPAWHRYRAEWHIALSGIPRSVAYRAQWHIARAAPELCRLRRYANQLGIDIRLSGIFADEGLGFRRRSG